MPFAFEKLIVYQKAVAFADAACALTKGFPRGYFFLADRLNRAAVDPRRLGRSNVVYCDGHAGSLAPDQLGYRVLPDGRYVDLEVVENPPMNRWSSGSGRDDDPPDLPE